MAAAFELSLSRLFESGFAADHVVAWRDEELCDWGDFCARVAGLEAALREAPRGRWVLFSEDSYAFAVGLLALWRAGCVAVLPPNVGARSLARLRGVACGMLYEGAAPEPELDGLPCLHPLAAALAEPAAGDPGRLDRESVAVELFTSGTTSARRSVVKRIRHLEDELRYLEAQWGPALGEARRGYAGTSREVRVIATASHQHLYGLLFRVLWPLAAGRAFHRDSLLHADELLPRLERNAPCVLVSVPAHLRRLAEGAAIERLRDRCAGVFSSGGPLEPATALRWVQALGAAPVEIFGSTETGGVAWRRQGSGGGRETLPWTPFEAVQVSRDEEGWLCVDSPFVSEAASSAAGAGIAQSVSFRMGDRVRILEDGRFLLEGRGDRVIKVGEKRLSLPEMERRLGEHSWVDVAALLPLEQAGEVRVAAVVVPSASGRERLDAQGRRSFGSELAEHLSGEWDRVLLPRVWRTVDALPEDAQGKHPVAELQALFRDGHPGDE